MNAVGLRPRICFGVESKEVTARRCGRLFPIFSGLVIHWEQVIAVFQDVNLAALFCDHLLFMRDGVVAAAGPKRQVLTSEILEQVFKVKARIRYDEWANASQVVFRRGEKCR